MTGQRLPIRVVKVGGSLLDWPALPSALTMWLARQSPGTHVLICGCGAFGDEIRRLDQCFSLGDETAHWLCVDLLSVTARLLAAIIPRAALVADFGLLRAHVADGLAGDVVFDARAFLREQEFSMPGRALPRNWDVTTDSIAARVAEVLAAEELVLLKSTAVPNLSLAQLAARGLVDAHFPEAAARLRAVRMENLRADTQRPMTNGQ